MRPTRSSATGSRGRTWSASRWRRCAPGVGSARRCGSRSTSGSRSPRASAAAAPMPPRCCGWPPASSMICRRSRPALGADVPSQLEPSLALVAGAGEVIERLPAPGEFAAVLIPDHRRALHRRGLRRGGRARDRALRRTSSSGSPSGCGSPRPAAPRRSSTPTCSSTISTGGDLVAARIAEALAALDEVGARAIARHRLGADRCRALRRHRRRRRRRPALPPRHAAAIISAPQRLT